ncbi:hypothetical protein [Streptomyces sp. NPDC006784]|uniref:hypothetical protein n=1 Tax=Streptomyces sp. NPDC006784 TaxID=3364764 RepID=UPI0036C030D0
MSAVVYLDQNHWVTMARARYSRGKVDVAEELEAADAMWELVRAGQVRLPLSSAHLVETVHGGTKERRRQLGEAMLSAYGGWHMLNPLVVRRLELIRSFESKQILTAGDVFTTAPYSPFHTYVPRLDEHELSEPQQMALALSWRSAWRAAMLEETLSERDLERTEGLIAAWANGLGRLAQFIHENPAERDMRLVTVQHMLKDLTLEIAQACLHAELSPAQALQHIGPENVINFFSGLPFLGRVMEIIQVRLRSPSDSWVNHDLNDVLFLACAAGYADFVVAENKTGDLLQRADRFLGSRAQIHLNLRSFVRKFRDLS